MPFNFRKLIAWMALAALAAATVWAVSFHPEPPADFTFVNPSEIKSVDPAIVTGQIEGRIIEGIFEGLTSWDPKTLGPLPGVAESWEISPDKRQYTFHLRADAKWTDGTPVTAQDFRWSHRRTLDPLTGSQYAYQLWYVKNARKYNGGRVAAGDQVEVELNELPAGALPFARGRLLQGRLVKVTPPFPDTPPSDDEPIVQRIYVVEIDGKKRTFEPGDGPNGCKQVLLDFAEVGCKAIDDHTYQMTLESPTAYFMQLTGMFPLYPVNPRCVATYGFPAWVKPQNIVTNGPFRLESRKIRERTRLVKSDTYWDRANVKLNTIDAIVIESDTTALNLYLTGKADWIQTVPSTIVKQLLDEYPKDFQPVQSFQLYFYRINVKRPALKSPLVRKALALAINKQEIVEGATRAGEVPARSIVPPIIRQYMPYEPAICGEYDPKEARKLLAQAGFPGGKGFPKIPILYNSGEELHKTIAELIQRQWKENLGIDTELQNQEWNAYLAAQQNLDYTVCRSGWIGDYVDPNTFLGMFITGGEDNQTGWGNPRYDELIQSAKQETNRESRLKMLHDAEAILMDELPVIPIYVAVTKNMVRPYVDGFYGTVLDDHPLKWISVDAAARQRFLQTKGL
jgi:oligopeptide transport system substrate-binding protein